MTLDCTVRPGSSVSSPASPAPPFLPSIEQHLLENMTSLYHGMHIIHPQQLLNKNKTPITTRVTEFQEIMLLIRSVPGGSRTRDRQLRRLSLYPAQLLRHYIGLINQNPPQ